MYKNEALGTIVCSLTLWLRDVTATNNVITWRHIRAFPLTSYYAVFWDALMLCSYHTHADLKNKITLAFKNMWSIISCLFKTDIMTYFHVCSFALLYFQWILTVLMFPSQYKQHRNNIVVHSTHIEIIAKLQRIAFISIYVQNDFLWCS